MGRSSRGPRLTQLDRWVLWLVCHGFTNTEIVSALAETPLVVRYRVSKLLDLFEVPRRAGLAPFARLGEEPAGLSDDQRARGGASSHVPPAEEDGLAPPPSAVVVRGFRVEPGSGRCWCPGGEQAVLAPVPDREMAFHFPRTTCATCAGGPSRSCALKRGIPLLFSLEVDGANVAIGIVRS